ncbi:conserved hypothetical protein [Kribbella flavida DSM 17836]|uniref:SnoaL-like domain-containing protein n=2 Tax=Kribbella flavida (strain DSM 17836 / JCM 10339 / NBRC 14399) TaxID=479435 RepID=D2Q2I7_KRIFD|nr:nuclear transport factor 2 family protein [Kribbella flavida]ADB35883.1 conserved hypothetical protein [Kribbella flavida DSM 17836]
MTDTEQTRALARKYFDTLNGRAWEEFAALLAEDVRYELPQTSERITGRADYLRFNQEYPGDWQLTVTRLLADGPSAAVSVNLTLGDERLVGVVFLEVVDGLVSRVTDFWPEAYEPPPGREHLVERVPAELDRFGDS